MDREALIKDRSVARCIAEGYRLFSSQQLTTLRRTWKPLVASSLGWALTVTTALSGQWIGTVLALLLALAALVVFKRTILQLVAPMPKCGRAAKRVLCSSHSHHIMQHAGQWHISLRLAPSKTGLP